MLMFLSILGTNGIFAQTPAGTRIDNVCLLKYANEGGASFTLISNIATVVVTTLPQPALNITKVASLDSIAVGDTVRYSILIENTGNVTLRNVSIVDTLTGVLNGISVSQHAVMHGQIVQYSLDSLIVGGRDSIQIIAQVQSTTPAGFRIRNRAYATATELDTLVKVAESTIVTIARHLLHPQLSLMKTASRDTVAVGDTVLYRLVIENIGDVTLTGINLIDTLASQITGLNVLRKGIIGGIYQQQIFSLDGPIVRYERDSMAAGDRDTIWIEAVVNLGTMTNMSIINRAYALAKELGSMPRISDASIVTRAQMTHPNLSLIKAASHDTVAVGDTVRYVMTLVNNGDVTLHSLNIIDTLSTQLLGITASSNAVIHGSLLTYFRDSLIVGGRDSIQVLAIVRSTAAADNSILNRAYATAHELGSVSKIAEATVVTKIAVLPPVSHLQITKRASGDTILVGQTVNYTLVLKNLTSVTALHVAMVDTLSPQVTPVRVSSNAALVGHLVMYQRDSVMAFQQDSIIVEVQVPANRPHNEIIANVAYALMNDEVVDSSRTLIRTKVKVEDHSCQLGLQVMPSMVIGNGINAAQIVTFVSDTTGLPKPDGTPVLFRTDVGYFSNGLDSILVATKDGFARDSIRALISSNDIVYAKATVSVTDGDLCNASSSIDIVFYPGAIAGDVVDNQTQSPIAGALVQVFSSASQLVGSQVTGENGKYLIPVPRTDTYRVVITVRDRFGMTSPVSSIVPVVVPGIGGVPAILNRSFISGRVFFIVSNQPLAGRGIKVLLSRATASHTTAHGSAYVPNSMLGAGALAAIDSTVTDSTGLYVFSNLMSGNYQVSILGQELSGLSTTNLPDSGRYVLNVNIAITLNPKISLEKKGPAQAVLNDTATYTINLVNSGNISLTRTVVIDSLDRRMQYLSASGNSGYDSVTHTVRWNLGQIDSVDSPLHQWSGWVHVRFSDSICVNKTLVNRAIVTSNEIYPISSDVNTFVYHPEIQITKTALKKIAEVGDVVPYVIKISNTTPNIIFSHLDIVDRIPFGFSLAAGSSFRDSVRLSDPRRTRDIHFQLPDSLKPYQTIQLTYRLIVGAGGTESDGINTAYATAIDQHGRSVSSTKVSERIEVRLGLFTDHGIVLGKIFFDQNHNAYQDSGEVGVKGVELILENGMRVITGDDGKYSIPDIEAGQHVIHVRQSTIPKNSVLVAGYNKFAGDAALRFVNVPASGIARADFYLSSTAMAHKTPLQLRQSVAKIGNLVVRRYAAPRNLVFFEDEAPASMRLSGLTFEVSQAKLRSEAYPVLIQLGRILKELPDQTVLISGHTDAEIIRSAEFRDNLELSIARANAVKTYLVSVLGCDPSQISTAGYGESWPLSINKTAEGRALNRRVEFNFSGKESLKKRDTLSVLFSIPISYDGSDALTSIEIHDRLDSNFVIVPESGRLGDQSILPQFEKGELVWKIKGISRKFDSVLRYRANIVQPGSRKLNLQSRTVKVTALLGDSLATSTDTLSTSTSVAVAKRGRGVNLVLSGVLFDVAKATLRSTAQSALEVAGVTLKQDTSSRIVIEGHTDSSPIRSKEFPSNTALSFARARTVAGILTQLFGISPNRMSVNGYGEFRPAASNDHSEGRQMNRRVEIHILRKEFMENVMPTSGVDSSAVGKIMIKSFIPMEKYDSSMAVENVSRYLMQLEVKKPAGIFNSKITLIDTLPNGWRADKGSISVVRGVDSVSLAGNILRVVCSNDSLVQVTFNLEKHSGTIESLLTQNTFVAVQNDGTDQTILDRARPLILGMKQLTK
jgi:uncharacterized repeat protein (TIGR01451 family)